MESESFTVLVDTREKKPWTLASSRILGMEHRKLDTGDYTIKGYEHLLCIDRKASVQEVVNNVREPRFAKELLRIRKFPHAFLVMEFELDELINFPHNTSLPPKVKKQIRTNGKYLLRCLTRMQIKYNFNIIYAGNRENAQLITINLMEDICERYDKVE